MDGQWKIRIIRQNKVWDFMWWACISQPIIVNNLILCNLCSLLRTEISFPFLSWCLKHSFINRISLLRLIIYFLIVCLWLSSLATAFYAAQIYWEVNAAQESKRFFPLGVIGAIVSWNYPFHNVFNPMLATVFSGNAAVIKVNIMV